MSYGDKLGKAKEWLIELLKLGEMSAEEIMERAKRVGISERTVQRAGNEIGAERYKDRKRNGKWYWHMPKQGFKEESKKDHEETKLPEPSETTNRSEITFLFHRINIMVERLGRLLESEFGDSDRDK